jgi:hypothetical protein
MLPLCRKFDKNTKILVKDFDLLYLNLKLSRFKLIHLNNFSSSGYY